MNTHTPGPWLVETDQTPDGSSLYVIQVESQRLVADCDGGPNGIESCEAAEANARLIAAAPELLEALKEAAKVAEAWSHGRHYSDSVSEVAKRCRNAIAKATGGAK